MDHSMSLISVNYGQIMGQLGNVLTAAAPLQQSAGPGSYSGSSAFVEELLQLCGSLLACASAYYGILSSDVSKAGALLEQLMSEDQQMGVMFLNE